MVSSVIEAFYLPMLSFESANPTSLRLTRKASIINALKSSQTSLACLFPRGQPVPPFIFCFYAHVYFIIKWLIVSTWLLACQPGLGIARVRLALYVLLFHQGRKRTWSAVSSDWVDTQAHASVRYKRRELSYIWRKSLGVLLEVSGEQA